MKAKSVLITGASRGLGWESTRVFGREGWRVFPLVRKTSDAEKLKAQWPKGCHPIVGDVASDDVGAVVASALDRRGGRLDALVNNAGAGGRTYKIRDAAPEEFRALFEVHCLGPLRCVRATLPYLKAADRPVIVNVSSRLGSLSINASGGLGHLDVSYSYRIAKAAQNMLTVCLDRELAEIGVTVFAVHPGKLKTALAAADADMEPETAAEALYGLIRRADRSMGAGFFDLMTGEPIPW